MWTVNQLATQLVDEAGGASASDSTMVTQFERWISDIYNEIVLISDWPWAQTSEQIAVVANTSEYSLSSAIEVRAARLAGSIDQKLKQVPVEFMQSLDLEFVGRPRMWFTSGYNSTTGANKIKLIPVPDASYTLELYERVRPAALAATDTIPIPEEFVSILKSGVRYMSTKDDRDYEGAQFAEKDYKGKLEVAARRFNKTSSDEPRMQEVDIPRAGFKGAVLDPNHYRNY